MIDLEKYDIAWLPKENAVLYSLFPRGQQAPSSAVVKLLQGVFDQLKDHSFFLLRKRIMTTSAANPLDQNMVKLVAKRIQFNALGPTEEFLKSGHIIGQPDDVLYPCEHLNDLNRQLDLTGLPADPRQATQAIAEKIPRGEILHDHDRPIAAVMLSADGRILAAGAHSAFVNKTLHAEVNLVQSWFRQTGRRLPQGAHLHVTQKPCKMCAAMILHWCEDPKEIKITWDDEVPGRHTRHGLLSKSSDEKN